jgi:hypothetical protein
MRNVDFLLTRCCCCCRAAGDGSDDDSNIVTRRGVVLDNAQYQNPADMLLPRCKS